MVTVQFLSTNNAPAAIGPYSQAVQIGNMIYTSGQIALDLEGNMVEGDIHDQTRQVLRNLKNVLESAGSGLDQVLKTTIYLTDMDDFIPVNTIYAEFFGEHKPARSTVCVKSLPKNAMIEIDAIALG